MFQFCFGFIIEAFDCYNNRKIYLVVQLSVGFLKMTINVSLSTKFQIENINGKIDFNLWHIKMCAFLVQQGLLKALKGEDVLAATLSDEKKKKKTLATGTQKNTTTKSGCKIYEKNSLGNGSLGSTSQQVVHITDYIEKKVLECSSMQ